MAAELSILVTAKDQASKVLQGVNQSAQGFGARLGTATKAGAGVAVAGLVALGAAGTGIFSDINSAQNTFQTQLGVSGDKARELGDIAKDVYKNNFGQSVQDAARVTSQAFQQFGDAGEAELQRITENAFRLQDAFGVDTTESIDAVKTLMENFGLTSQEAFDLVASGFQKGLNRSDDFLDTIGEYSTQFSAGGATATEFFSLLESGLQGGMLGTDKAADAFKEFRVRILDGSKTTSKALEQMGIDAEDFTAKLARGEITTAEAFDTVLDKLRETDDASVRMQAGVGLLGTQYEDMGDSAALAMDLTSEKFANVEGAAESLNAQYDTMGNKIEGWKRTALLAIAPVGESLMGVLPIAGNLGMAFMGLGPVIGALGPAFSGMAAAALPALQGLGMALLTPPLGFVVALVAAGVAIYIFRDEILAALGAAWEFIKGFAAGVWEALKSTFDKVLGFARENWPEIATLISGPFFPLVALATDAFGIRSALEGAFNAMVTLIGNLATSAYNKARDFGNSIYQGVKVGINAAIDAINSLIRAWNGLSFRAGGGSVLGVSLPSVSFDTPDLSLIPRLQTGLPFVPFDDFPALLHRGERVMTAAENRRGDGMEGVAINVYGPMTIQSNRSAENADETLRDLGYMMQTEMLRRGWRTA